MTKRRKLAPRAKAAAPQAQEPEKPAAAGAGGFWGGSAINLLQKRLDTASTEIVDRIAQGLLVVELDPDQIDDDSGSDRQDDWKSDESLKSLVDDIKRRGQSQPIRVRPENPDWKPSAENPLDFTGTRFIVQSGRRRLESCRKLGISVRAIIRTDQSDALRMDLEERFLENTVRRDLSAFEELLSIGLIVRAREDEEQKAIATELHVTPSDVSLGLACLEFFDIIVAEHDVTNLAKRDFRQIIPAIRKRGKKSSTAVDPKATPDSPGKQDQIERRSGKIILKAVPSKTGFSLFVKGWQGDRSELADKIEAFLTTLSK